MRVIQESGPFARFAVGSLGSDRFTLLDIGCSGGIDSTWRIFGEALRAIGFDPNVNEVARLREAETLPGVSYEAAFVGVPPDHPISKKRGSRSVFGRNPADRLAVTRTIQILADRLKTASTEDKTKINIWDQTALTESPKIYLPDFISTRGLNSIDFIKIDIDGDDFDVLQSLAADLSSAQVLGLCLEVNLFGSEHESDNTFHNTDRFMRARGFELFKLTHRSYSAAALPQRYIFPYPYPAQSEGGRPYQGDALYLRDICAPDQALNAANYGVAKLVKSAILFSLGGLPDHAAEVLVKFREPLAKFIDVDEGLDLLASETVLGREQGWNFAKIKAAFESNDPLFYSSQGTTIVDSFAASTAVGEQISDIALSSLSVQNEGTVTQSEDGIDIVTALAQWAYSALVPLSESDLPAERLVLRVKLRVTEGEVGLAVATEDLSAPLIAEVGVPPSLEPRIVEIPIPNGEKARFLIIRNWAPTKQSSTRLYEIAVFRTELS